MARPPQRGEVWVVDHGYEGKVRRAVVLSVAFEDSDRALVTVVGRTTSPRGSRFEVNVPVKYSDPGVFDAQNIFTVDKVKCEQKLTALTPDQLSLVEHAVMLWLGLHKE